MKTIEELKEEIKDLTMQLYPIYLPIEKTYSEIFTKYNEIIFLLKQKYQQLKNDIQ